MKALQNPRRVHVQAGHGHLFSTVQQCKRPYVLRNPPLLSFQDSHLGGRHDPFPVTSEHKRTVQKAHLGFSSTLSKSFFFFSFFFVPPPSPSDFLCFGTGGAGSRGGGEARDQAQIISWCPAREVGQVVPPPLTVDFRANESAELHLNSWHPRTLRVVLVL